MGKEILVMTGSARRGGNSDLLADAFIRGASRAGHRLTKYEAAFHDIRGCLACNRCYSLGEACVYKDDFNALAPLLERADAIVFSTPLYWYSFPAKLKAAMDKFYALITGERPLAGKESALMVAGADDRESGYAGILGSYGIIADYLQWKDRGRIVAMGLDKPGAVRDTQWVLQAEELGATF